MTTNDTPAEGEPLARDIMTAPAVTVTGDMSVKDLVALFRDKRIGGVPVVDDGKVVGIISRHDIMKILGL